MAFLSWIQLSSQLIENTAWPLDWKQRLDTNTRLELSITQRWIWMLVYDTDLDLYKQLVNEPWTTNTTNSDWETFWTWIWWTTWFQKKQSFNITSWTANQIVWTVDDAKQIGRVNEVLINWLGQVEWIQYTVNENWDEITFDDTYLLENYILCLWFTASG